MLEKQKDYFATRYSLIPDSQLDFDSVQGVTKEDKFMNWLTSFETEKKKELLLQELYDAFTVRNEQSDKPYNVTVSIGACALEPDDEHSLADALSLADEQLYEVKKLRKKDVAKIPLQA